MSRVLLIKVSPRGERSRSLAVAGTFLEAYRKAHPDDELEELDLFTAELPAFDAPALEAKYAILRGEQPTAAQRAGWRAVEALIEQFTAADKYVIAAGMWNFSIPYRLKHYIDVLVQPGYTFTLSDSEGYQGLVTGKPAVCVLARGGAYADGPMQSLDHQRPYLETILGFVGIEDVRWIVVEPTEHGSPAVRQEALAAARARARELAETF